MLTHHHYAPFSRGRRGAQLSKLPLFILTIALSVIGFGAHAAKSPHQLSIECRNRIASETKKLIKESLHSLDACHAARDKGERSDDCNVLAIDAGTVAQEIGEKCAAGDPVLLNYPGGTVAGATMAIESAVETAVHQSGIQLQGAPNIVGNKDKIKCHKAIGKARSAIVNKIVSLSTSCQKKRDRSATDFGPLDPACAAGPGISATMARQSITRACSPRKKPAISGGEVGSCALLPECVIDLATLTGQSLAAAVFKMPSCGDGVRDFGEGCDPGADQPNDCCTAGCQFVAGGTVCRAKAGECDLAETCGGTDASCPPDAKSQEACRIDACDVPVLCDGSSDTCPAGLKAAAFDNGSIRRFVSTVFAVSRSRGVVRGTYRRGGGTVGAGAGAAPSIRRGTAAARAGGGKTYGVGFSSSPATLAEASTRTDVAVPDRLFVIAGADGECLDKYELDLGGESALGAKLNVAAATGDAALTEAEDEIEFDVEFVESLGLAPVPLRFALGDANGPTTAFTTVMLEPTGGFLRRVADLRPGEAGSDPEQFTAVGDMLFFVATVIPMEPQIWKSNGSEAGTVSLTDPSDTVGPGDLKNLTAVGSRLYFTRCERGRDCVLFQSEGTRATTSAVANVTTECREGSTSPVALGETLYFTSDSSEPSEDETGCELWRSDTSGTMRVADIQVGRNGSSPDRLTSVGPTLFFVADDGSGIQIWASNGTEAGTIPVTAFDNASRLDELTAVGNALYFVKDDETLWKVEGSPPTAAVVVGGLETVSQLRVVGTTSPTLFFEGCDKEFGCELWRSDGTAPVRDITPGPGGNKHIGFLTAVDGVLFFAADDGQHGEELWKSDGTEAGTTLVKDIVIGPGSSNPDDLTAAAQRLFFSASDGIRGTEIWESDGTEIGTVRVKDFLPGSKGSGELASGSGTAAQAPVAAGATLYFRRDEGQVGAQVRSDDEAPQGRGLELWALRPFGGTPPTATPAPTTTPTPGPNPTIVAVAGSCCQARPVDNPAPGCESAACAECICTIDAFCCVTTWDGLCADEARNVCADRCPCVAPTPTPTPTPTAIPSGDTCCAPHGSPGCDGELCPQCAPDSCAKCVCDRDPFCCAMNGLSSGTWDQACVNQASDANICASACGCDASFPPTPTPDATPSPLANDSCEAATQIVVGGTDIRDVTTATTAPTDPLQCAGSGAGSVWYRLVAPFTGSITVDTFGSSYDTVLGVYAGSCGALQPVTCNDDTQAVQSQVVFTMTEGTLYFIEVTQFGSGQGLGAVLQLHVQPGAVPQFCGDGITAPPEEECDDGNPFDLDGCDRNCRANDRCEGATPIDIGDSDTRDTVPATSDPSDPLQCFGSGQGSVWYRFTSSPFSIARTVSINTFGSNYDTVLGVYTGNCGNLQPVPSACSDDAQGVLQSQVSFTAAPGITYLILVTSFSSGPPPGPGSATLQLSFGGAGTCGDGLVEDGEQCDDGNAINGDGCSSACQAEGVSTLGFRITSLGTTGCASFDHTATTGDDRGGIAATAAGILYNGDAGLGRYDVSDMSIQSNFAAGTRDALTTDLVTGRAYVFADAAGDAIGTLGGGIATQLREIDPNTGGFVGPAIPLSLAIPMPNDTGIFAGASRTVVHNNMEAFDVQIPSGLVVPLGAVPSLNNFSCETFGFWGVAEFFDGALHVTYRDAASQQILRTRLPDGATTTLASFSNLSDMCAFVIAPFPLRAALGVDRWYWHHEGESQFGAGNERIGFCNATIERCGDGIVQAPLGEQCDDGNLLDGDGCSARCRPSQTFLFADDMEAGAPGWTHELLHNVNGSVNDTWALSTARAFDGTTSFYSGPTAPDAGDTRLISPIIDLSAVSGPIFLRFNHFFSFDDCGNEPDFDPDGAIIEVSVASGPFNQVPPVDGYPNTLDDVCGNPIALLPAFTHESGGSFIETTVDLSSFAGQTIRLGFHVGWDCGNCVSEEGWYIDNVRVSLF